MEKSLLQELDILLKKMEKQGLHNIIEEVRSKHFIVTTKQTK